MFFELRDKIELIILDRFYRFYSWEYCVYFINMFFYFFGISQFV